MGRTEIVDIDSDKIDRIDALSLQIASAETIRSWSSGEVKNFRGLEWKRENDAKVAVPTNDGLFSQQIFGPLDNWSCACGRYRGRRYEGTVCESCGVEVTHKNARRKRMGHIELAYPVVHPWFTDVVATLVSLDRYVFNKFVTKPGNVSINVSVDTDAIARDELRLKHDLDLMLEDPERVIHRLMPWMSSGDYESDSKVVAGPKEAEFDDYDVEDEAVASEADPSVGEEDFEGYDGSFGGSGNSPQSQEDDPDNPDLEFSGGDEDAEDEDAEDEDAEDDEANAPKVDTSGRGGGVRLTREQAAALLKAAYHTLLALDVHDADVRLFVVRSLVPDSSASDKRSLAAKLCVRECYEVLRKARVTAEDVARLVSALYSAYFRTGNDAYVLAERLSVLDEGRLADICEDLGRCYQDERVMLAPRDASYVRRYARVARQLIEAETAPKDMMLSVLPVIPPDLRPLITLGGGGIASTDVNELYKKVLYYNARIKEQRRLLERRASDDDEEGGRAERFATNMDALREELGIRRLDSLYGAALGTADLRLITLDVERVEELVERRDQGDLDDDTRQLVQRDLDCIAALQGPLGSDESVRSLAKRTTRHGNVYARSLGMLQQAVIELLDTGGRGLYGRGDHTMRSLLDGIKGKQGRFRKNLLGKRVDYSGRSVIVVDPSLRLHQCGLPKEMALELFKPFVEERLKRADEAKGITHGSSDSPAGSAGHDDEVTGALEAVIKDRVVLLNRAPTLHRLSVQAFEPVLVEGKAIHLHPMVCKPFNADFDGDNMAVHVPLSPQALEEARDLMMSTNNLRTPASGEVQTAPSQDMVFGIYFLTTKREEAAEGRRRSFASFDDAVLAYHTGRLGLQEEIEVRVRRQDANAFDDSAEGRRYLFRISRGQGETEVRDVTDRPARMVTTAGRIIFNSECLLPDCPFVNHQMRGGDVRALVDDCCDRYSSSDMESMLDAMKLVGFRYATSAGLTVSVWDAVVPANKAEVIEAARGNVERINGSYESGLLTNDERHREVIRTWQGCSDELDRGLLEDYGPDNPIFMMADSGARGSKGQLSQLVAMRGLMTDERGGTIETPITTSLREGMEPLEYFMSAHGTRKGFVDASLGTGDAGYLTRQLVHVAQDVVIQEEDCGTDQSVTYDVVRPGRNEVDANLVGRCVPEDVVAPSGEVLISAGDYIRSVRDLERLRYAGIEKLGLRSSLTCTCGTGVCQRCYGWDLSTRRPVEVGAAVGIIAAQSIGEPGTQLTLRTVNSGGVAGTDITDGLPAVRHAFGSASLPTASELWRGFSSCVGWCEKCRDFIQDVLKKSSGGRGAEKRESMYHELSWELTELELPQLFLDECRLALTVQTYGRCRDLLRECKKGFAQVMWRQSEALACMNMLNEHIELLRRAFESETLVPTARENEMHDVVSRVHEVYEREGIDLNVKHIELIVRQMLGYVEVMREEEGSYQRHEVVGVDEFANAVRSARMHGKRPPIAVPRPYGIRSSGRPMRSWLSRAAFEHTKKALTYGAIGTKGTSHIAMVDDLVASTIVGARIPAGTGFHACREGGDSEDRPDADAAGNGEKKERGVWS